MDEVHGFKYFEVRDLLGFVDGTENPTARAAEEAVTIGAEDPHFAGGSYVIVQKYLHDLMAWNVLPVEMQERAVGRTKLSDFSRAVTGTLFFVPTADFLEIRPLDRHNPSAELRRPGCSVGGPQIPVCSVRTGAGSGT